MKRATFADDVEFCWAVLFFVAVGLAIGLAWCAKLPAAPFKLIAWVLR